MPSFEFTVLQDGAAARRRVQADDLASAQRSLNAAGVVILNAPTARAAVGQAGRSRRHAFPLGLFCRELAALLEAGLTSAEALGVLWQKADQPMVRSALGQMSQRLREGRTLSQAMALAPAIFPELLVAVVGASELTGQLASALRRFIDYQGRVDQLRRQLVSALMYPSIVLLVGMVVVLFMLLLVIPGFASLLSSLRGPMPLTTRLMLDWAQLLAQHGTLIRLAIASLLGLLGWSVFSRQGRGGWLGLLTRLPRLQAFLTLFELTRFYSAFGLVLQGGMPIPQALKLAGSLLGETRQLALGRVSQALSGGAALSDALVQHEMTTPVAEHLLRVGEHTGEIGAMCEHIVRFHDEQLARVHELAAKVLGPLVMLVVGVMVGGLVVMLYLPIFDLAGGLG